MEADGRLGVKLVGPVSPPAESGFELELVASAFGRFRNPSRPITKLFKLPQRYPVDEGRWQGGGRPAQRW